MIRRKKRNFSFIGSLFSFISAILLLVINFILVADNALKKISDGDIAIREMFSDWGIKFNYEEIQPNYDIFSLMFSIMFFISLAVVILAIKNFKKPLTKDNQITYRKGNVWLTIIFDIAIAAICAIGAFEVKNLANGDTFEIVSFVLAGLSAVGFIFLFVSLFIKTNVFTVKEKAIEPQRRKPDIDTIFSVEKLSRVEQLKAIGAISDDEYKEMVAKFSRGA